MNFKQDILGALKTVAPTLAGAFAGPFAPIASSFVATKLGLPTSKKPEDIGPAIAAAAEKNPDILLQFKQYDVEFQEKMQQAGIDLEKIAADDRASARAREIAVKDKTPAVLAYSILFGFFTLLGLLIFKAVPNESREILSGMTGVLGTMAVGIKEYFFGSSSGSAAKTAILSEQLNK